MLLPNIVGRCVKNKPRYIYGLIWFAVVIVLGLVPHSAHAAGPNGMAGQGVKGIPFLIETCEDLQAVDQNLSAYYQLANDIDCSDTINWHGGQGFRPIGWDDDNELRAFTGHLDGRGFAVSDIYMDYSSVYRFRVGIFEQLGLQSKVLNIVISNVQITAPLIHQYSDIKLGGLAGEMSSSAIDAVRVSTVIIDIPCVVANEHDAILGGISGSISNAAITRSSVTGAQLTSPNCDQQIIYSGGIAGKSFSSTIEDSFAQATTMHDSRSTVSEFNDYENSPHRVGGLIGYAASSSIDRTYAQGTITMQYTSGDWQNWNVGGLIGESANTQIMRSFTQIGVSINLACNGTECDYGVRNLGYMVGYNATGEEYSTNYYDETLFGQSIACDSSGSTTCTAVNTTGAPDPNYFYNQPSNPPMDTWNFTANWSDGCMGCAPGVPAVVSLYPQAPFQLNSSVGSETSINIFGQFGDYIPPGTLSRLHDVYYKKSTDANWILRGPAFEGTGQIAQVVEGLEPGTQYDFMFLTEINKGYYQVSDIFTGRTARPGFTLVTDCEQLQEVDLDLFTNYELGNDIDCSDTINWNGGAGFNPIGDSTMDFSQFDAFTGVFAGNNYTISDLYVDNTGLVGINALFIATDNSRLQDVRIENMTQISDTPSAGGGLVGFAMNTSISNVHISGGSSDGAFLLYGGVMGSWVLNAPGDYELSRSSYDGSVTLHDTFDNPGFQESYGGLIGQINANAQDMNVTVENNYAINDLYDTSGVAMRAGLLGFAYSNATLPNSSISISNVYTSGTMQFIDSYPMLNLASGIIGVSVGDEIPIHDSFSHVEIINAGGLGGQGGVAMAMLDAFGGPLVTDWSSNYFDADRAGTTVCEVFMANVCNAISGEPSYFYNNSTNPPLNAWDFINIWQTTSTLPVFGQSVTQTISEIPSQFLNGGSSSGNSNDTPPIIDTNKQAEISNIVDRALGGATDSAPSDNPGLLEQITNAIKDFVRNLPEPIVRAFPYLLFGLISGGVLLMSMETRRQMRHLADLRLLIAKQRSIAQQRDTFWHLAANYLRAPVTLLMGGAELLTLTAKPKINTAKSVGAAVANKVTISKTQATTAKTITTLVTRIQTKVTTIMEDIEGSETLRGIAWPKDSPVKNALHTLGFWVSIIGIILLLLLANYIMVDFRGINPSSISYLTQAVLFGLVAYAIYWALNGIYGVRQNVATAEKLIARQSKALTEARGDLVGKSASSLSADVMALEGAITKLPAKSNARQPLTEGASRLRNMIDSFELLQAAETSQLADLSPAKATSEISTIMSQSLNEERPQIIEKKLAINLPKLQGIRFPGSTRLAKQVVGTVLDNAIAFSPTGSTVDVEVVEKPGMQGILIHDQGPGVSKDQLDHMFEPFTKADGDDALRMNHEGLGIDLYVNRLIMEQLGGKISATSTLGKGTTIQLLWPAR